MNTVSIVGSVSRRAGGLFESVRRLHGELLAQNPRPENRRWDGGGPQRQAEAPGLFATDMQVQVLSLRDEFTDADLCAWHPVPVRSFGCYGPRAYGYAPGLRHELFSLAPDLVHVHGLWQYISVASSAWYQKAHRPYLVSPHGMLDCWSLRHSGWKKTLSWLAYERAHLGSATCIHALGEAEVAAIRALGLTNPICVIPNGVDLPRKQLKAENQSNRNGSEERDFGDREDGLGTLDGCFRHRKVLLYLGRLHPKKGLPGLLRAWAKVRSNGEWVLVIAGWDQSGHESDLQRLAQDLDICWSDARCGLDPGSSLFFVGPQFGTAKTYWFRRCDAFILPSFSEGLPMAVLEAWAHAKPVLMTPQCNLPEGFAASAALRIDPEPEAIAGCVQELFSLKPSVCQQIGLRGVELVANRFNWPRIAADLRAVYRWMTGGGCRPSCVLAG